VQRALFDLSDRFGDWAAPRTRSDMLISERLPAANLAFGGSGRSVVAA
jgi:hypothetical protein